MGLLVDLGLRILDNIEGDVQRIGRKAGVLTVSWADEARKNPALKGLMWRIPDTRVEMAYSWSRMQRILVTEYEQAIVLRDGRMEGDIPPGMYDVTRTTMVRGTIEVIWFTKGEFQLRWGVGDIITQDGASIGASGHYNLAIVDPYMFLINVARNEQVYKDQQLLEFARQTVSNAIRDQMAYKTVMEFQKARPEFEQACLDALRPPFERWGLEFRGLSIEAQNIPEEYRVLVSQEGTIDRQNMLRIKGAQADLSLAQIEMQKAQFAALAEANRLRLIGSAQTDVMQGQMGIGLDPLELQRIEAMKLLAEHPSEGVMMDERPQIMAQLQPPMPLLQPPPVIVTGMPVAPPPQQPPVSAPLPAVAPSAQSSATGPMTREKIEEMLDKLDERFANGEISEQVYLNMQSKWQKRLEQL